MLFKGSEIFSLYILRGLKTCNRGAKNLRGAKKKGKKIKGSENFIVKNKGSEKNGRPVKKCSDRVPGRKNDTPLILANLRVSTPDNYTEEISHYFDESPDLQEDAIFRKWLHVST